MHSVPTKTIRRAIFVASFILFFALALPGATHAATPTFTAIQTVAPVTLGNNTQTAATSSTVANVVGVKATRTLTVGTIPVASTTIAIGTCTVTFATTTASHGTPQSTNCAGGNAIIRLTDGSSNDIGLSTTQIANALLAITSLSDTGHGALTVTASSTSPTSAVFTTTGTETSATNITFSDGTSGKITSPAYATVTGVIPVAQAWAYIPAGVEVGDTFTAIINGTTISYTAATSTVADVTAGLAAAINGSAQSSAVLATDTGTQVNITSKTAGTPFTVTTGTTNRAAVAQAVAFTPTNVDPGYTFQVTINGTQYMAVGGSVSEIVTKLASAMGPDHTVSCTQNGTTLTCTAFATGTTFTYASAVVQNQSVTGGGGSSGSSGGSGGGGSHSSSSSSTGSSSSSSATPATSTAGMQAQLAALQAQLAVLMAKAGGSVASSGTVSGSFARDLDIGATGSDVMALQVWLNSHGFTVAASGAGSPGNETSTFGGLTQAALAKWQASVGITPSAGYFGPKTRAYIAAHS